MNNRHGRNPNGDLQRHIVTGETGPFNGEGLVNFIDDAAVNYDDPMEFGGQANTFEGQSVEDITAASEAQHSGLDSAAAFGAPLDLAMACDTNVGGVNVDGTPYDTGTGPSIPGYGERGLTKWRRDNGQ
jgi:hypothetical protein